MLFKRIKSEGIAHFSYLLGDKREAVVIDPRRDIQVYLNQIEKKGYKIKAILETHRHEDFLLGSLELKEKTGSQIYHADDYLPYQYGKAIQDQQIIKIGDLKLKAIHTPGHTPGSFTYLLYTSEGEAWMVFTGDLLFAGGVGRVDFMGEDKLREYAGKMYDSIYNKVLPLGDEVILCPAHGSGSVCASSIASREWTTIGIEKNLNPSLKYSGKEEFIEKEGKILEYAPYFKNMEKHNLKGAPFLDKYPTIKPLSVLEFKEELNKEETVVIDTRLGLAFATAHIPKSISLWQNAISNFISWFVNHKKSIVLVTGGDYPKEEIRQLYRLGFDKIKGYLAGSMVNWHMAGEKSSSIKTITVDKLCNLLDKKKESFILDIRSEEEIDKNGKISSAEEIHITQLPNNLKVLPEDKEIYIFCGSGLRSMTAASFLKSKGYHNLNVVLGGLEGWSSISCPIK